MVCLKLTNNNLFNCLTKTGSINYPKSTVFYSCSCRRSIYFIKKCKLSKSFSIFENFCCLLIYFDLHRSSLYNVETSSSCSLPKDNSSFCHGRPKHMLLHIIKFLLRKVVKDEMIFKRVEDELFVSLWFWFSHWLYSFISNSQSYLIKTINLILLLKFFNHVVSLLILIWQRYGVYAKKKSVWEKRFYFLRNRRISRIPKVCKKLAG